MARAAALLLALSTAWAATKEDDKVTSIPGFEAQFQQGLGFDVYSGYLDVQVPKASTGYDSLSIHYELHTCRAKDCPLALWHQGGPGGSAVFGAWTEMGPFQLMAQGPVYNEKNAWNNAAHMLYLESPAGSTIAGAQTGYSTCFIDGEVQDACKWTDVTQAVAYAHSRGHRGLPRESSPLTGESQIKFWAPHELYLTGDRRATLASTCPTSPTTCCSLHIASRSLDWRSATGCWGGTQSSVQCNGPNAEKNDIDIYLRQRNAARQALRQDPGGAATGTPSQNLPGIRRRRRLPLPMPRRRRAIRCWSRLRMPSALQRLQYLRRLSVGRRVARDESPSRSARSGRSTAAACTSAAWSSTPRSNAAFDVNGGYPWDCSSDAPSTATSRGRTSNRRSTSRGRAVRPSPRRLSPLTLDSRAGTSKAAPRHSSSGRIWSSICAC